MTDMLKRIDAWWRAANYLAAAQIYLMDNPLLNRPLERDDIKPRLLGHWGTSPGLNFVQAHLNRIIIDRDLDMLFIVGPGHGAPAVLANAWLDGSYSETYPDVGQDETGLRLLFRQFSFPGGVPSHAAPPTPGSIHEGGELGYALAHAIGAALDNPDLTVACVIGDGEAETAAMATSWQSHRFLLPGRDGAVLPILHLNGYRIAAPTVMGRMTNADLCAMFTGLGWAPCIVSGDDPDVMHRFMAETLDRVCDVHAAIRAGKAERWPMIVLRSPKGWTGPDVVDGLQVEGTFRAHQVPLTEVRENEAHRVQLADWLQSYDPAALFPDGRPNADIRALAPRGPHRIGANPHANGGRLLRSLDLPDPASQALTLDAPGGTTASATHQLGKWLADVMRRNPHNFRLFGPDETQSNKLDPVFQVTARKATGEVKPSDVDVTADGRVMEVLSEHLCEGWLEGYLLTGRHGLFNSYEAFIHIVSSMVNQHIKWLRSAREVPWRAPIASLNYLLTSHVWRQDHNGFSHQDPGFLDHLATKGADLVTLWLPPDANTFLHVADTALRSRNRVNVIVAGKQVEPQWLDIASARDHVAAGFGVWAWAANDNDPEVVLAAAGDVPTLEMLAAVHILRDYLPDLRLRVVNVVALMALQPSPLNPDGAPDAQFDGCFTTDRPVIFAFHGYPGLIHELTYRRTGHANFHVHGYAEKGSTTTPFDMTVLNGIDRFTLALDAVTRSGREGSEVERLRYYCHGCLAAHHVYIRAHGEDLPAIVDWRWRV
ncbi:phosphoketolase family protein [Loktanella sp. M215]|uniref:phosphoketolase family protein n=1 Tax=Loktanella sp. M215 TaxID=2675431 RepID=UPI001F28F9EA|nr:phosphoketolase family protein [Loktanella sp. M215]MCF7701913.1 phosphoketolase [Loktanella sp. M215]